MHETNNEWLSMDSDGPLPDFAQVDLSMDQNRALGSVHVDGEELVCPWTSWEDNKDEIEGWFREMDDKCYEINKALVGTGLVCTISNILDKVINPRGMVLNFQIRQKTEMATKEMGGTKFPEWYNPVHWPTNNPDGDEFQKIICAGCLPAIPPP